MKLAAPKEIPILSEGNVFFQIGKASFPVSEIDLPKNTTIKDLQKWIMVPSFIIQESETDSSGIKTIKKVELVSINLVKKY